MGYILTRGVSFRSLCFFALCGLWVALAFSKALVEIFSVTALVAWAIWKVRQRHWEPLPFPRVLWIPLLGYALLSCVSIIWSEYPAESFRGIFKILQQLMIFYLVIDVMRTEAEFKSFEKVFLFFYLILIADGFFQYYTGRDFIRGFTAEPASAGLRVSASFGSYGLFAAYLIATIPFLAALGLRDKKFTIRKGQAYFCTAMTVAALVLLFLTRSRGAFLALIVGFAFFLVFKRKFIILLMLFLALVAGVLILPRGMVIHLDADGKEQSIVERYYLWDRAVSVIRAKPFEGTGINTYDLAHARYDRTQNWRVRGYYAHNGYLQTAAETGLPCLIFLLIFLFQYVRLSLRARGMEESPYRLGTQLGLLTGIVNFLALVMVDTVLHNPQPAMTFWYLMGLQWSHRNIFTREAALAA